MEAIVAEFEVQTQRFLCIAFLNHNRPGIQLHTKSPWLKLSLLDHWYIKIMPYFLWLSIYTRRNCTGVSRKRLQA